MRRRPPETPERAVRSATLLTLAVVLLLLCGGGLAVQKAGASALEHRSHVSGVVTDHAGLKGPHLPALVESPDSEESVPVGSEHLNTLVAGLFLVSLALLLGTALLGRAADRRLLEMSRLTSIIIMPSSRGSLSELEVFRL